MVADLVGKAFNPTHLRDDPLIYISCSVKRTKTKPDNSVTIPSTKNLEAMDNKGNILIRDLWQNGTEFFHDMRVMNTYNKSRLLKTP